MLPRVEHGKGGCYRNAMLSEDLLTPKATTGFLAEGYERFHKEGKHGLRSPGRRLVFNRQSAIRPIGGSVPPATFGRYIVWRSTLLR